MPQMQKKMGDSMSWKMEVQTGGDDWNGNAIRLATKDEAEAYARDLMSRWILVTDTRVVECQDPVNYRFNLDTRRLEEVNG